MVKSAIRSVTYDLDDTDGPETITWDTHDIKLVILLAHGQITYALMPHKQDGVDLVRSGFMVSAMYVTRVEYVDGSVLTEEDI